MTSPAGTAPIGPPRVMGSVARHPGQALLTAVAVIASCAAMALLARQADGWTLDYDVGIVPVFAPWVTAGLSIVVAAVSWNGRRTSSTAGSLLVGTLVVVTAWSVVILPFDALRVVGLVPLPLSSAGAWTRLFLLVGSACALVAAESVRRASQGRCPECRRVLAGRLDRLPRWPVAVGVAAALVYPTLRTIWALGGTFGTAGEPLHLDVVEAWAPAMVGAALVAFATVLLIGSGPVWARALVGLGGVVLGSLMTMAGGLGAAKAASVLVTEGIGSVTAGSGLMTWTFVVVYGSWFVAGVGIIIGGWRFWSHRRDTCPACRTRMGMP